MGLAVLGRPRPRVYQPGGNNLGWAPSTFWEDAHIDTWWHMAATRSGIVYSFWVDEEDLNFASDAHDEPIGIGAIKDSDFSHLGPMDVIVIVRSAYSHDDIKRLMNAGIVGSVLAVAPRGKLASTWAAIKNCE